MRDKQRTGPRRSCSNGESNRNTFPVTIGCNDKRTWQPFAAKLSGRARRVPIDGQHSSNVYEMFQVAHTLTSFLLQGCPS
jgi:hypothetical protein